jgi:hypothetical protein
MVVPFCRCNNKKSARRLVADRSSLRTHLLAAAPNSVPVRQTKQGSIAFSQGSSSAPHNVYKGCTPEVQGMYKGFARVHPVYIPCAPLVHGHRVPLAMLGRVGMPEIGDQGGVRPGLGWVGWNVRPANRTLGVCLKLGQSGAALRQETEMRPIGRRQPPLSPCRPGRRQVKPQRTR